MCKSTYVSRSIHEMLQIVRRFVSAIYCATEGGVRKTYCACSRNDARPLTSWSSGMPSKKTMELLKDVCTVAVETVLRHGRMFQGSDEV